MDADVLVDGRQKLTSAIFIRMEMESSWKFADEAMISNLLPIYSISWLISILRYVY